MVGSGEQTFREALRTLVFRWSANTGIEEIIRELEEEAEKLRLLTVPLENEE